MNKKATVYFSQMVLLNMAFVVCSTAQVIDESLPQEPANDTTQDTKMIWSIEQMPTYKYGAEEGLLNFIAENINYPSDSIKGRVYVSFVVDTSGKLNDIKLLRKLSPEADKEAIRLTNLLEFNSGRTNGKPISVTYNLPIDFTPSFYEKYKHKSKRKKKSK